MRSKILVAVAVTSLAGFALAGCNQQQQAQQEQAAPPPAAEQPAPATAQADMSPEGNTKFLDENKAKPDVKTTASGLQYKVIKAGAGKTPTAADVVTVTYKGWLIDGTVFDQTEAGQTASFPAGQLIPGWVEALQMMKEGDEWEIVLPSNLGYGEAGAGGVIPPNQTLVFNMALLKVGQ